MQYDVIIIGAGAAGLFCAIEAGKRKRKVLLLEKSKSIGNKIRISGGGRCNFTNIHASPENYISNNSRFCISALKRYTQQDFIKLVEQYNIKYHEKTLGQLFCDDSAKQIINMLLDQCKLTNVDIRTNIDVTKISKQENSFHINTTDNTNFICDSLVIASGGLSIPKMGATSFGYDIAKQFGLNIIAPSAALVPFTLEGKTLEKLKELSGISVNKVTASCNGKSFTEAMLFTHRGLSGPAILQISSYWNEGDMVTIDLAPDINIEEILQELRSTNPKQDIQTSIANILPKRLALYLCNEFNYHGKISQLSNQSIQQIHNTIHKWQILPNGTEGFRTAEVTLGGLDTNEVSSKTFEIKKVPGLYFIGEVIDVTGHLGGFNFQWAWSSAYAAGQYV